MYLTADTHFGHQLMSRMRGYENAVEEHDRALIEVWNDTVRPKDTVWHLGDFMFGNDPERFRKLFARLNGRKCLVRGNHDGAITWELPWAERHDIHVQRYYGRRMVMCHYRMADWPGSHAGAVMLYGHRHGQVPPTSNTCDVGVDCWGMVPVHVDAVFARMAQVAASAAL